MFFISIVYKFFIVLSKISDVSFTNLNILKFYFSYKKFLFILLNNIHFFKKRLKFCLFFDKLI